MRFSVRMSLQGQSDGNLAFRVPHQVFPEHHPAVRTVIGPFAATKRIKYALVSLKTTPFLSLRGPSFHAVIPCSVTKSEKSAEMSLEGHLCKKTGIRDTSPKGCQADSQRPPIKYPNSIDQIRKALYLILPGRENPALPAHLSVVY